MKSREKSLHKDLDYGETTVGSELLNAKQESEDRNHSQSNISLGPSEASANLPTKRWFCHKAPDVWDGALGSPSPPCPQSGSRGSRGSQQPNRDRDSHGHLPSRPVLFRSFDYLLK